MLLTECLQNDFFRNRSCSLCLPAHATRPMLYSQNALERQEDGVPPRRLRGRRKTPLGLHEIGPADDPELRAGPLATFLEMTVGARAKAGAGGDVRHLHVINIRDWHGVDESYDQERRTYGAHCERGSWGADYLDGFGSWLDPAGPSKRYPGGEARDHHQGCLSVYHIHSDSVFDFKPSYQGEAGDGRFQPSELEMLLDILTMGTDAEIAMLQAAGDVNRCPSREDRLALLREVSRTLGSSAPAPVYVAVLGVYTDIKIQLLVGGLRTRYLLPNLALSDTFTASPSLERHLAGLDFSSKVFGLEILHGVDHLVRFLGGSPHDADDDLVGSAPFSKYQSYLRDKQEVLAYQSQQMQEYALMTERRAAKLYRTIQLSNQFLLGSGCLFLIATFVLIIARIFAPDQVGLGLPVVTGGVGLVQVVALLFTGPMERLQRNLTNLTTLRMILDSHSLKMAFTRYYVTNPQALREIDNAWVEERAKRQVAILREVLEAIERIDKVDFLALGRLGFDTESPASSNGSGAGAGAAHSADSPAQ